MSRKILRTELSILEKHFPRHEGSFQIAMANPEELVCRFVDSSDQKYTIQCSISVSSVAGRDVWSPCVCIPCALGFNVIKLWLSVSLDSSGVHIMM